MEPQAMLPQPKQAKELFGIREIKQWAKPIMEYYGTLDSANCAGFAFAVCNKMLEKEGRINTEIASIRNAWRVKRNLNTKEFAKFDKKALFEVENGQQPQRFVKSSDGKLVYTALEEGQAQRIWNEMKNAPAGTMLTVLYSRTLTGAEQGRGEDEPSHVLVCAGNGRWADEIDHVVNVYDVNSMGGFRNFNEKFHFVEDSMMFRLKAEKFPSAPAKIEITADSLRFAVGKETVSPVKFAAAVRERTGMPFEYVLAEMLNQNKISGEQEEIGRKDAKVVLKVPANWDAHSQLIARADTLLQRISGQ